MQIYFEVKMDIKYEILEKELNNSELKPIYLLYGDEKYLIDTMLKKIKNQFGELVQGINYVVIDDTNVKNLIFNIEVPAFGYDTKLIVAKNTGLFKKDGRKKEPTPLQKEVVNYIEENFSVVQEMAVIVFIESEVDKNAMYDVIQKNGIVCEITELKPVQLVAKLKQICGFYKVACDDATLQYLLETSGTNLQILINEIRKLIEYVGEGGTITCEAVDQLAIRQIESVIFDLTDHLGNKKTDKAMEVLDNLIYQKEPLQKILVTLYNHFKKLYLCTVAQNLNKDITTALSLKPNQTFLVNKYKKQASYFKQKELKQILQELVEMDYKSKNGLVDINIALKSVLCNYCS